MVYRAAPDGTRAILVEMFTDFVRDFVASEEPTTLVILCLLPLLLLLNQLNEMPCREPGKVPVADSDRC